MWRTTANLAVMTPPSETVIRAWARLVRAERIDREAIEAELKASRFPPLAWYDCLLELHRADGHVLRPLELESRLLLAQHNVSRLIDRLEAKGYVERRPCEDDGRGQLVALKPHGLDLLRAMWPVYRDAIARHVGGRLGDDEAETLAKLLGRVMGL